MKINIKKLALVTLSLAVLAGLGLLVNLDKTEALSIKELRSQSSELEEKIAKNTRKLNGLQSEIDTLAGKTAALQTEIDTINQRIELTNIKVRKLKLELERANQELERQQEILATNLQTLYMDGNVSTAQLLFASESFNDFFLEQEYLERLKLGVQNSVDEIESLKAKIEKEKKAQQSLLAEQRLQKETLQDKRDEQAYLLEQTRGQESRYQQILVSDQKDLARLQAELASAIAAQQVGGAVQGGTGGYPYANVSPWHWLNYCYVDPWGMCQRQCVSYTAWKVHIDHLAGKVKYDMPYWGGSGNANQWDENAVAAGIPTGTTPKAGAIAVLNSSTYGHTMYVESVLANGNIWVSQYNANTNSAGEFTGTYSQQEYSPNGLTFIYFQEW